MSNPGAQIVADLSQRSGPIVDWEVREASRQMHRVKRWHWQPLLPRPKLPTQLLLESMFKQPICSHWVPVMCKALNQCVGARKKQDPACRAHEQPKVLSRPQHGAAPLKILLEVLTPPPTLQQHQAAFCSQDTACASPPFPPESVFSNPSEK